MADHEHALQQLTVAQRPMPTGTRAAARRSTGGLWRRLRNSLWPRRADHPGGSWVETGSYRLRIDVDDGGAIGGRIRRLDAPHEAVPLDLLVDGHFHARVTARTPLGAEPQADDEMAHRFRYRYSGLIRRKRAARVSLVVAPTGEVVHERRVRFDRP